MKVDPEVRRRLQATDAERTVLRAQLAQLVAQRDGLIMENAALLDALDDAGIEKTRMAILALDGLIADAELAERKARRRQASAKTGTKSNPTLEFAREWVMTKVRAEAHKSHEPAHLHWMLMRDAEDALGDKAALVPTLKWLNAQIRRAVARVENERAQATAKEERARLEAEAVEHQRRLNQIDSFWMPVGSSSPNQRRSSP